MSNDLFILNTDPALASSALATYPSAQLIDSDTLSAQALEEIVNKSFTRFFYVLDPKVGIKDFDFTFTPSKFEQEYVHVWKDSKNLRLFNRKIIKDNIDQYTDDALSRGLVQLKNHGEDIFCGTVDKIKNEPEIFLLCPVISVGKKFQDTLNVHSKRVHIIEAPHGLTDVVLRSILETCQSYYFYVVNTRIEFKRDFDFTLVPDHWEREYVHVWGTNSEVRLFNKPDVELDINSYTDAGWENGKTPLKILDDDLFIKLDNKQYHQRWVDERNDIFVHSGVQKLDVPNRVVYVPEDENPFRYASENSNTLYFYLYKAGTVTKDFDFTFLPTEQWMDELIHMWQNRDNIVFCNTRKAKEDPHLLSNFSDSMQMIDEDIYERYGPDWPVFTKLEDADVSSPFFVVDDDVELHEDFRLDFVPEIWDKQSIHVWQRINPHTETTYDYSGVYFYPESYQNKTQYVREPGCITKPFDVIMLSYKEEFADQSYERLLEKCPHAKRVHGVKGIFEAHKAAAELAETPMFYVVDADAHLEDNFNFFFMPRKTEYHKVYVWRSRNPINDLVYGYGGVKLFPRQLILDAAEYKIDFTTSISEHFMPIAEISNTTMINTSPFNAWRSAFRECVKLSSKVIEDDKETQERLDIWCKAGANKENGKYAILGANMGREYGEQHAQDTEALEKINDYEWLLELWKSNVLLV